MLLCSVLTSSVLAQHVSYSDGEIRAMLARRVNVQRQAIGAVVGVTEPGGRRIVAYGAPSVGDSRALDGDSVFEIASITKVFTALLLADMAARGEVRLDDPVRRYLPAREANAAGAQSITLFDLATHTSGLPLRPANLASQDGLNKYAGYTKTQLYEAFAAFHPSASEGRGFVYSNFGYAILGQALANRADTRYEQLLTARITGPLALADTRFELTESMRQRLAVGHTQDLRPGAQQQLDAIRPAGGLHSTANDLLNLLDAMVGRRSSALSNAMASMFNITRPTDRKTTQQALGWRLMTLGGQEIVMSNGSADGYRSFIGFDRQTKIGVVALANAGSELGVDDIGQHLINAHFPVNLQGPNDRKRIELSAAVLDRYVGRYVYSDGSELSILRDGSILAGQDEQGAFALIPESETAFFMTDVDAQITFAVGADGESTSLTLHQNGKQFGARRME